MSTSYLTGEGILAIHFDLVALLADQKDTIDPPGPRDLNLLHSAALRPHTSLGGTRSTARSSPRVPRSSIRWS